LENSFLIKSDGNPGDLQAKLSSVSESRAATVEILGKDSGDHNNGGDHPWSIVGGDESTLILFNHSTDPQHFNVHIGNVAVLWEKDFVLQPMQTQAISIKQLIQGKAEDDHGKTLPETLTGGQIGWFIPNHATGKGRLLLSNRSTHLARNFSCRSTQAKTGTVKFAD
jgi:hypothetical protein